MVGETIATFLWGGFAVDNPTLNRFFSLHYLLPFMIVGVVDPARLGAARRRPEQPDRRRGEEREKDTVPFTPYATIKDVFAMVCFLAALRLVRLLLPELSSAMPTTTSRPTRW